MHRVSAGAGNDHGALADDREEVARLRSRYIDLIERALTHMLYRPFDIRWAENPEPDD